MHGIHTGDFGSLGVQPLDPDRADTPALRAGGEEMDRATEVRDADDASQLSRGRSRLGRRRALGFARRHKVVSLISSMLLIDSLVVGGLTGLQVRRAVALSTDTPSGMISMDPSNRPALVGVTLTYTTGEVTKDNGCSYTPPPMSLSPSEVSVEADQIAVDSTTCQAEWQIGTPLADQSAKASSSTSTSSGNYKAWETDIIGLVTTSVQSNLSWAHNDVCDTSPNGGVDWWWRSGTGWQTPTNKKVQLLTNSNTCATTVEVTADADYKNVAWCWPVPPSVTTHYRNIHVFGGIHGALWNDGTSVVSHSFSCGPLYEHYHLTRTT